MIPDGYSQRMYPYAQQPSSLSTPKINSPARNNCANLGTTQNIQIYQQEIEKLKKDKKYADFYIITTALIGIVTAIGAFIASRTKDIKI